MTDLTCDVAIIGAGTAGLTAERAVRELGGKALLIDPKFFGTLCTNTGCMPSKLLIAAGNAAHEARHAHIFGVHAVPEVDGPAVMRRMQEMRNHFVDGVNGRIARLPDEVKITSRARFDGPTNLVLEDGRRVSAKAIVIATGSEVAIPQAFADLGDAAVTNETIFDLPDLPKSLAVIGAGVIGIELAQAMARLGVAVQVFSRSPKLGISRNDDVNSDLHKALEAEMVLHMGVSPTATRTESGVRLTWGEGEEAAFDKVLLATGRRPSIAGLGLETTGAALDTKGLPEFDVETLQIGDLPIFIAGDANADHVALHEASLEGNIAGRNAMRYPDLVRAERLLPFQITFCDPIVASLGTGPDEAETCGSADYYDQGRAKMENINHGRVVVYGDADGKVTGADLCAPGGDHLAHLLAWAIVDGKTAAELLRNPFYHPTLTEGLKPAFRAISGQSGFELEFRRQSDDRSD